MVAKLVAAGILLWLLKPRGEPSVTVGEDYTVVFRGKPSDFAAPYYTPNPGDPP